MFLSPRFASYDYLFIIGYCLTAVGFPIQTSTDLWLFTPPRRFSQCSTSFFASWYLGIRPSPFCVLRICTVMNILFFYLVNEPSTNNFRFFT